jgi:hypothetical protein
MIRVVVIRDADVGGQSQRLQHVEQAVFVQCHNLERGPAPSYCLRQVVQIRAIALVGEVGAATRGNQRPARMAADGESFFQRRARGQRQAAITDQDEIDRRRHFSSTFR